MSVLHFDTIFSNKIGHVTTQYEKQQGRYEGRYPNYGQSGILLIGPAQASNRTLRRGR